MVCSTLRIDNFRPLQPLWLDPTFVATAATPSKRVYRYSNSGWLATFYYQGWWLTSAARINSRILKIRFRVLRLLCFECSFSYLCPFGFSRYRMLIYILYWEPLRSFRESRTLSSSIFEDLVLPMPTYIKSSVLLLLSFTARRCTEYHRGSNLKILWKAKYSS